LRIAQRADRPFEQLLAAGLTTIVGVQSFLIIGGVTRLLPLTGITLPFVSYGGSSIIANWILIALLLRISSGDRLDRPVRSLVSSKRGGR
jgi:peptidoglycan glycosyltransferase